jgi:uncharacterized protein GlcG (DUF336 family)
MKRLLLFILFLFFVANVFAQHKYATTSAPQYIVAVNNLSLEAAFELQKQASELAVKLGKHISIAILDASGTPLLMSRGAGVGPHNTEAARRKAFTALSTKTATLELMRNAAKSTDTQNLNSLPELLLLSGGTPIYYQKEIIGSIGISGGGSAENDDTIAQSVGIAEAGISTKKL